MTDIYRDENGNEITEEAFQKMPLHLHARAWHRENGRTMPDIDTPEGIRAYEQWVEYAFADLGAR